MIAYSQPLGVVLLGLGEQGSERVVAGDDEASKVGEELTTQVEDDEEEVKGNDTDDGIGLGDTNLLLEIVQGGVLGQLGDLVSLFGGRMKGDLLGAQFIPPYRASSGSPGPWLERTTS